MEHAQNSPWNIYATLRSQDIDLLIESLIIVHWSLIWVSAPIPLPRVQKIQTFILLTECWVFNLECWQFLLCVVIKLYSRYHHLTYEREYISRVSGGLGDGNKKRIKHGWDNNSQKTTRERARSLSLCCISLAPTVYHTRAELLAFPAVALLCGSASFDYS